MIAFRLGAPTAIDRMLAAAHGLSLRAYAPTGLATPPVPPDAPTAPLTRGEAYTLGYRLVARPLPVDPVVDADACAEWLARQA